MILIWGSEKAFRVIMNENSLKGNTTAGSSVVVVVVVIYSSKILSTCAFIMNKRLASVKP